MDLFYTNTAEFQVVVQGSAEVPAFSELFYAQVLVSDHVELKGMLGSGSIACTLSETAEQKLRGAVALPDKKQTTEQTVFLVGCGGKQTHPKCMYKLKLQLYGVKCVVPTPVVPGQRHELIIGSNAQKHLMPQLKNDDDHWRHISKEDYHPSPEHEQFHQDAKQGGYSQADTGSHPTPETRTPSVGKAS